MCQEGFNGVSIVFQASFKILRVFQKSFEGVPWKIRRCFKVVFIRFKGYLKEVQREFQGCFNFKGVSRKFQWCFN